ncbi:MAG: phosphoenolpyruvate--protein phosphotransferase [Kiritimatiellae bacterium]|nr:phosphoenolpyruvate--protein phosphotransferase [Kiritimatiellia bacterium]
MKTVTGLAIARGFVSGPVFIYRGDGEIPVPEYVVAEGEEQAELERLKSTIARIRSDLEKLIAALRERTGRSDIRVFECHLMILEDEVLMSEIEGYVKEDRLNAEAAVRKAMGNARALFGKMHDQYFRERVRDIDDVERRLLKKMTGIDRRPHLELKSPAIVVADDLTPSETVQLPREFVLGFATNKGSTTSHVALLARALAIPAVAGLGDITAQVAPGERILLDGTNGAITLNPDAKTVAHFEALVRRQKELDDAAQLGAPAGTLKDGGDIRICANTHPGIPVAGLKELGARGVGLYRSEYLWLDREFEPSEEEQFKAYKSAAELSAKLGAGAAVTIRALDIGGDKTMRGISTKEANPFLGNRSIRYLLSQPATFRTQLRAILRASAFGKVRILYPMISCVEELQQAAVILAEVKRDLDATGLAYDKDVAVGAMIEVPSAAIIADEMAELVDFFSIGTNDLVQYTLAADRGNDAVAYLYQPLHPAIIRLVRHTVAAAKAKGIPVAVCGESASDPVIGVYWASLGVDTLSMSATFIPSMARILARLTRADLDDYAKVPDALPRGSTGQEIFNACHRWMVAKIPDLEETIG